MLSGEIQQKTITCLLSSATGQMFMLGDERLKCSGARRVPEPTLSLHISSGNTHRTLEGMKIANQ